MARENGLNLPGLTIDPPQAKDLDDAIWVQKRDEGYSLQVCIADVASEVRKGSPTDIAARKLGFTRYGEEVLHMLPEPLANDKLSLLPGKERRVFAISIWVSNSFEARISRMTCTTLTSRAKLSYFEADAIMADSKHDLHGELKDCYELASGLLARRRRGGAIAIHDASNKWTMTEEGHLRELIHDEAHRSHIIVQEFMILTNYLIAAKLSKEGIPTLFRNHQAKLACPEREVLLSDLAGAFVSPKPGQIEQARERNRLILDRAVYAPILQGHFGLSVPAYTHFTSPIRRYPDLVVQRTLHALVEKENPPYAQSELEAIGAEATGIQHRLKEEMLVQGKRTTAIMPVEKREEPKASPPAAVLDKPLSEMNAKSFRKLLLQHLEIKNPRRDLVAEVSARLQANKLSPLDIYHLLVGANGAERKAWGGVKTRILEWLDERPFEAASVMSLAIGLKDKLSSFSLKVTRSKGGSTCKVSASVVFKELSFVASCDGTSKKTTGHRAIALLWKDIVEAVQHSSSDSSWERFKRNRPEKELPGSWTLHADRHNFISALQELCIAKKVGFPAYETIPSDLPALGFRCICKVVFEGNPLQHEGSGPNKRAAKQSAARLVYGVMVKVGERELAVS